MIIIIDDKFVYKLKNKHYQSEIVDIIKVESKENLADVLTKALDSKIFIENRNKLRLK